MEPRSIISRALLVLGYVPVCPWLCLQRAAAAAILSRALAVLFTFFFEECSFLFTFFRAVFFIHTWGFVPIR
jgi:hypothetical protein